MKVLSASDILFSRAHDQIEQALLDQEVAVEEVPESQFLPDAKDGDFLDPNVVKAAFAGVAAGGSGDALDGAAGANCAIPATTRSTASRSFTLALPSGVTLDPAATITATGTEIQVDVQNGGDTDESDIAVSVSGAASPARANQDDRLSGSPVGDDPAGSGAQVGRDRRPRRRRRNRLRRAAGREQQGHLLSDLLARP